MRAGARESPGQPLGWQSPGPSAIPGVVAAPPAPEAASEPACGSPPAALWEGVGRRKKYQEEGDSRGAMWKEVGRTGRKEPINRKLIYRP